MLVRPHLLHKGILSREHVFRCARLASATRSSGHRSSGEPLSARRCHRAGSCAIRHRTAVLRPQLPVNRHFATAHQADWTPVLGLGARCRWLRCSLAPSRNPLWNRGAYRPADRSTCAGFESGRFLAALGVSRVVSGRAGNAWETSMAVAILSSRCAIAKTGKWRERGLCPANRCGGSRMSETCQCVTLKGVSTIESVTYRILKCRKCVTLKWGRAVSRNLARPEACVGELSARVATGLGNECQGCACLHLCQGNPL